MVSVPHPPWDPPRSLSRCKSFGTLFHGCTGKGGVCLLSGVEESFCIPLLTPPRKALRIFYVGWHWARTPCFIYMNSTYMYSTHRYSTGKPFKPVTHVFSSHVGLPVGLPCMNLGPSGTEEAARNKSCEWCPLGPLANVNLARAQLSTFASWFLLASFLLQCFTGACFTPQAVLFGGLSHVPNDSKRSCRKPN